MNPTGKRWMIIWLWSGFLLVLLMVAIGGITRLTGSGLSMVEWNLITGAVPPTTDVEWQEAFSKYQQFPEYQKLNYHMEVEDFKQIFFWEYLHRMLGRFIGILFLVPFVLFVLKGYTRGPLLGRLLLILLLGAVQGGMGWFMVKSGLVDLPHVSHFRLAAHLTIAFLLLGAILHTIYWLRHGREPIQRLSWEKVALPLLVLVQVVFGAFVAGLKGGFSYTDWPLMGGEFYPEEVVSLADSLWNSGIFWQFVHRWFAFVVLGFIYYLFFQAKFRSRPLIWLFAIVNLQVLLGILTLIYYVPVWLGVGHQVVAAILFSVAIVYVLEPKEESAGAVSYA